MTAKTERDAAVARIAQFTANSEGVRKHLELILESQAFKGSRRSQEFLRYVVEKSLSGDFEGLKERILGVEVFSRPPTYDTSEDAIVRVTAIDVRKRLLRYYKSEGASSDLQIHLSSGSYVPEFTQLNLDGSYEAPAAAVAAPPSAEPVPVETAAGVPKPVLQAGWSRFGESPAGRMLLFGIPALTLILGLFLGLAIGRQHGATLANSLLPWSAIFQKNAETQLVFCDTSLDMLQEYFQTSVSLSDYANRRLLPDLSSRTEDAKHTARLLGGPDFSTTTAPIDLEISARISALAHSYSHDLTVKSARELRFRDFKTDGNFILLGSPRSNPWTGLFQDRMDFYFSFDPTRRKEVILNRHPRNGEQPLYVPTAAGGGTGDAFAIAAFLGNPEQNGNVLILAGSNAEATEAAARFASDPGLLPQDLRNSGIDPIGPPRHFEALLRVTTMAGSPNRFDIVALHTLQ